MTRRSDLSQLVDGLTERGAILVSRSACEPTTGDLDEVGDAETGFLSIAELCVDAELLSAHLAATARALPAGETMIIDLTASRLRVAVLPVGGIHGLIVRDASGVRRFPRPALGFGRDTARRLVDRVRPPCAGQIATRGIAA
ncbi:MAG: hypothetical protein R3D25_13985 [Geminicoccaceae bacterium]